ncbi:MAG: TRIC cation channel family protein, partial [Fibrobacteraceae bacterium]|nr:TRIC cation channel family protein [Fibrobacteraceae bacterium]
ASSKIVLIADALGLGFFTAIGASKAEFANAGPLAIILLATLTAAGGGLLRDMLVSEIPQVLKSDFYATAAIAGGILFVLLDKFGVSSLDVKMATVTLFTFALRIIAMRKNFQLPKAE